MSSILAAAKQEECSEEYASDNDLAIDLGENQRKAVVALIEARSAMRQQNSESNTESLLSRASLLFGKTGRPTNLADIVDRSSSLMSLRRTGFTPEDFVQYGPQMTYKRLTNAYDIQDLVQFGFTFPHFCQLGFDSDDLRQLKPNHYRILGLNAPVILEKVPLTGQELIALRLEPHLLRELRFTFSHFVNDLGMNQSQLSELMPERELKMYFNPSQSELMSLQKTANRAKSKEVRQKSSSASSSWKTNGSGPLNF